MHLPPPLPTVALPTGVSVLADTDGKPRRFESVESAECWTEELRRQGTAAELCLLVGAILVAVNRPARCRKCRQPSSEAPASRLTRPAARAEARR